MLLMAHELMFHAPRQPSRTAVTSLIPKIHECLDNLRLLGCQPYWYVILSGARLGFCLDYAICIFHEPKREKVVTVYH